MIAGPMSLGWGRHLRFNVRGLIVLVFVVGAGMGWSVHCARIQRRAVVAIQKAGGAAYYDFHSRNWIPDRPWAPKWLVDNIGIEYFGDFTNVTFVGRGRDAELVHVGNLSKLEHLILSESAVTDVGLADLKNLTRLQMLNLYRAKVTDAGLEHLGGLSSLERLYLHNTQVAGTGFVHFKTLGALQRLTRIIRTHSCN
jgi:internalin A